MSFEHFDFDYAQIPQDRLGSRIGAHTNGPPEPKDSILTHRATGISIHIPKEFTMRSQGNTRKFAVEALQ